MKPYQRRLRNIQLQEHRWNFPHMQILGHLLHQKEIILYATPSDERTLIVGYHIVEFRPSQLASILVTSLAKLCTKLMGQ